MNPIPGKAVLFLTGDMESARKRIYSGLHIMVVMKFLRAVIPLMTVFGMFLFSSYCPAREWPSEAAHSAPPRLWKVQKQGTQGRITTFYFLGASHLGLPIEYDDYFNRAVLPAFTQADILLYEGVIGREPEPKPVCDSNVLTADGRKFVAEARREVEQVYIRAMEAIHREQLKSGIDDQTTADQRRNVAHMFIAGLDEFDLRDTYLMYAQVILELDGDRPVNAAGKKAAAHEQMAVELRRRRPDIPVRNVDTYYGVHRAYCSAGPERISVLRDALAARNSLSDAYLRQVPQLEQDFVGLLLRKPLASGAAFNQLAAVDRTFVCQRNAEWLRDIRNLDDGKVHFYVLGLRHLFPVDHDDAHCGGLLADLEAAGLIPQLVE